MSDAPHAERMRVAAVLTCHNRRDVTVRCLEHLFRCELPVDMDLEVIIVDDGSTDGTSEAVAARWPRVHLLKGDGNLFWAGGTRKGMIAARNLDVDAHLWLNDDVVLDADALETVVGTYRNLTAVEGREVIVVGSMRDPETGETTYGGVRHASAWHPLKFSVVAPGDAPRRCDTMNGNLVLIPREVIDEIGVLSDRFVHSIGDFAYGLEAARAGFSVWICPGHQGTCSRNVKAGTWEDHSIPLVERFRKLSGAKGLPVRAYTRLAQLAGARPWPLFVVLPYVRVLATSARYRLRQLFEMALQTSQNDRSGGPERRS